MLAGRWNEARDIPDGINITARLVPQRRFYLGSRRRGQLSRATGTDEQLFTE